MSKEKGQTPATPEAKKEPQSLKDLIPKEESTQDDAELFAKLRNAGADDINVDMSMPDEYETEIMAALMVDHMTGYTQTKAAWRSARNTQDHKRAADLFQQMQFNRLTVAIIQAEYPGAKPIADTIMKTRTVQTAKNRDQILATSAGDDE
ncbi:MAG: hypothetical protein PHQ43_00145 [Dehalococcoidales bacterium]|nr:hypothetical protein [Dehalococcoidales bacterium]